jgi:hypothetical protein
MRMGECGRVVYYRLERAMNVPFIPQDRLVIWPHEGIREQKRSDGACPVRQNTARRPTARWPTTRSIPLAIAEDGISAASAHA